MSEEEKIELFDSLTRDKLTPKEKEEKLALIKSNDSLVKDYAEYQNLTHAIKIASFRNEVKGVVERNKQPQLIWISGIAASLALAIGLWLTFDSTKDSSNFLFEEYYSPYPNVFLERGNDFEPGFSDYSIGDYKSAVNKLEQLKPSDTVNFYLGQNLLAMEEYQQAIRKFNEVSDSSVFYKQSKWYSALSYLAIERFDSSESRLKEIEEGDYKYDEALDLLEKISKSD